MRDLAPTPIRGRMLPAKNELNLARLSNRIRLFCRSAVAPGLFFLSGCDSAVIDDYSAKAVEISPGALPRPGAWTTYRVGEARVLALLDARRPTPASIFQNVSSDRVAELLRGGGEATTGPDGVLARSSAIWAFLADVSGRRILVDAGGEGLILQTGGFAAGLAASGVNPASIDAIVVSHLHMDHIGGLLDAGRPRFPNARLYLDASEAEHWTDPSNRAAAADNDGQTSRAARRLIGAYGDRVQLLSGQVEIAPGFTSEPLAGHTAGHRIHRLKSGEGEMIFTGDMIHSLAVQMPRPDVTVSFDSDQDRARSARLGFLRSNLGPGVLFAGTHFRSGVVSMRPVQHRYRAEPAPPSS